MWKFIAPLGIEGAVTAPDIPSRLYKLFTNVLGVLYTSSRMIGTRKVPFRVSTHHFGHDVRQQRGLPRIFRDYCDAGAAKHTQAREACFAFENRLANE